MTGSSYYRRLSFGAALSAILLGILIALVPLLLPPEAPLADLVYARPLHFILPGILTLLLAVPALLNSRVVQGPDLLTEPNADDMSGEVEERCRDADAEKRRASSVQVVRDPDLLMTDGEELEERGEFRGIAAEKRRDSRIGDFEEEVAFTIDCPRDLVAREPGALAKALKLERFGNHPFPSP